MTKDTKKALKEVYVILNSSSNDVIKKLPVDLIEFIISYMDNDYDFQVDLNKSLLEQKMMDKTQEMLSNIYEKYLKN